MKKNNNKEKIKILYIIPSLQSGGAERFILDLIYNLDQEKFFPQLLLFNSRGQEVFYQEAVSHKIKIKIIEKRFKIDLLNFFQVYKYIKKNKPDIVHTQLGGDVYGKLAAKLAGIKKIISTEQNVLHNDGRVIRFLKRRTAYFSDKIIAISSAVKRDISRKYKISSEKINLISNGIDVERFKEGQQTKDLSDFYQKIRSNPDQIIFGSVGRLSPQKNFSLLIEALARVKNNNFKCFIVGEGELRPKLEKQISSLKLEDKIKLVGPRSDIYNFLSTLDFFVLPSRWEGLGIVLLEAGICSLPVLASATGGILDIVKNNKTGVLFKNNSRNDLIKKLNYFLDKKNEVDLKKMGLNLNKLVLNNFAISEITKKYENLYLNL